jgi:phage gpG-like protein
MESGVTVDFDDQSVQRTLRNAITKFGPRGAVNLTRLIGYAMRASTLQKFKDERGPRGKWQELAESTIEGRRGVRKALAKAGRMKDKAARADKITGIMGGVAILQDTGLLKRSIHSVARATEVDIGTALIYGAYQQEGAPRAHIPARPYLYVDAADGQRMEGVALKYLERALTE